MYREILLLSSLILTSSLYGVQQIETEKEQNTTKSVIEHDILKEKYYKYKNAIYKIESDIKFNEEFIKLQNQRLLIAGNSHKEEKNAEEKI